MDTAEDAVACRHAAVRRNIARATIAAEDLPAATAAATTVRLLPLRPATEFGTGLIAAADHRRHLATKLMMIHQSRALSLSP